MEYEFRWGGGHAEDVLVTTSGDAHVDQLHEMVQAGIRDPRFRRTAR